MKALDNVLLVVIIVGVCVLCFRSCGDVAPVTVADSIRVEIQKRDSIIIDRDTVIYRTNNVREIIHEYHNTTDTVMKLVLCDSMAIACDSQAVQFRRQDSIYREQIVDYERLVAVQDSMIKVKPKRRLIPIPVPIPIIIRR